MSATANFKHHLALVFVATGVVGIGVAVICGMMGAGQQQPTGLFACSFISAAVGGLLVWRGFVMRNRAVASGSTVHLQKSGNVRTSRSGTAKPSFLEEQEKDEDGHARRMSE